MGLALATKSDVLGHVRPGYDGNIRKEKFE